MRRLSAVLIGLLVVAFLVYSSIFIVNEREQALVLRFGEITRVIREPGHLLQDPDAFVDTVQIIEDRLLSFDLEDIRVQVRDGRRYIVDAFVAFSIIDPRKFRENVSGSLEIARENMRTRLDAALRRVYGQRSFEAALSEQRGDMMVEVRDQLRPLTTEVGIEIVDVRIKRTDLLPEVSQQTFERMKAERLAEAAQLRARGTELAARIRAEADREAVVTVAEARARGGDPARPGRRRAEPHLRRGVSARSGLLRVLPLDARLRHVAERHRHDAGAVAGFGVPALLPECCGRRLPQGWPLPTPPAAGAPEACAVPRPPSPTAAPSRAGACAAGDAPDAGARRSGAMRDVAAAIGLVLALEGALYALFPDLMRRMAQQVMQTPGDTLRVVGVVSAALGVALVWLVRG